MHLEAIKLEQRKIFSKLKNFPDFYLVGGTALALQIGHRISIDFDLFSKDDIPTVLLDKVERIFKEFKVKIVVNHSEQLSVKVGRTKIDFVTYHFPLILKPTEFKNIKILPILEIAAMKAYALNHRGTLKDYVDLYFVLKDKYVGIKEIKNIAEKKYRDEFNFRLFLEQLVYLDDVKREKIEFLKEKATRKEMKNFFEEEIKKLKL